MNMTWILVLVIRKNSIEVRNLLPNGVKPLHTGPCHDTIDAVICHDTLGQYVTQWVNMKFNMRVNMRVNMISLWIGKLWWQLINDWLSTSNDMSSILTSWANASERIKISWRNVSSLYVTYFQSHTMVVPVFKGLIKHHLLKSSHKLFLMEQYRTYLTLYEIIMLLKICWK